MLLTYFVLTSNFLPFVFHSPQSNFFNSSFYNVFISITYLFLLTITLSFHLLACLTLCHSLSLFVYQSVCLSLCLCICLEIRNFLSEAIERWESLSTADKVDNKIWRTSYLINRKKFRNHLLVIWQQRYHIPRKENVFREQNGAGFHESSFQNLEVFYKNVSFSVSVDRRRKCCSSLLWR